MPTAVADERGAATGAAAALNTPNPSPPPNEQGVVGPAPRSRHRRHSVDDVAVRRSSRRTTTAALIEETALPRWVFQLVFVSKNNFFTPITHHCVVFERRDDDALFDAAAALHFLCAAPLNSGEYFVIIF